MSKKIHLAVFLYLNVIGSISGSAQSKQSNVTTGDEDNYDYTSEKRG